MRTLLLILLLLSGQAFGKAPECPLYSTKQSCLLSVENKYNDFLKFLYENEGTEAEEEPMIQAAKDIRHFETIACKKTCLN